jgi:hypothetical protein
MMFSLLLLLRHSRILNLSLTFSSRGVNRMVGRHKAMNSLGDFRQQVFLQGIMILGPTMSLQTFLILALALASKLSGLISKGPLMPTLLTHSGSNKVNIKLLSNSSPPWNPIKPIHGQRKICLTLTR